MVVRVSGCEVILCVNGTITWDAAAEGRGGWDWWG